MWPFSDCAINLNPDAEQLSEIALQSAETARAFFGIDPKVCMLSYSNFPAPARDRTWTWSRKPLVAQGEGSGSAGGRFHPVRRRLVPHRPPPRPRQRCGRTRQRSSSRTCAPATSATSRAALLRRLGHRPGAAGSQQAGKRPVPWCSGCRTSSTPSPSPPSKRSEPGLVLRLRREPP